MREMDPISSSTPTKPSAAASASAAAAAAASTASTASSPSDEILTPEKPLRAARSLSYQISTPEKPVQHASQIFTPEKSAQAPPRFPRGKDVAYSLRQVRRAALGLGSRGKEGSTGGSEKDGPGSKRKREGADGGGVSCCSSASVEATVEDGSRLPDLARKRLKVARLPEKYELLEEFFKYMVRAIRLLKLKRQVCILSNIGPQIETLTNRRFSHHHLAQLKYILPEAILIKRFNKLDSTTSCMKADLQIDLVLDAFGDDVKQKKESGYTFLERTFRKQLENFCNENPEGDDVPEDDLPEPFNRNKPSNITLTGYKASTFTSTLLSGTSNAVSDEHFMASSLLPGSFKRRFSQKTSCLGNMSPVSVAKEVSPVTVASPVRSSFRCPVNSKETSKETLLPNDCPIKEPSVIDSTPVKILSTPLKLMLATPELKKQKNRTVQDAGLTPVKRCVKRPLLYPGNSNDGADDKDEIDDEQDYDSSLGFLPKHLLQSLREKERKSKEDQLAGVPEANRRKKMIACLPKLFDIIHLISQSAKRSIFTKHELVNKIITSHFDLVDKTEVEKQVNLLLELVPEWLKEERIFSGDIILRVDKIASPEVIRERLIGAE